MKLRFALMALGFAGLVGCDKKEAPAAAPPLEGPPTTEECTSFLAHNETIVPGMFTDSSRQRFIDTCPTTYSRAEIKCAMKATDLAGINACDPANKK